MGARPIATVSCYKTSVGRRARRPPARKHDIMPSLPRPIPRTNAGLNDPRSTGAAPPVRVRDILALRGTLKTRS